MVLTLFRLCTKCVVRKGNRIETSCRFSLWKCIICRGTLFGFQVKFEGVVDGAWERLIINNKCLFSLLEFVSCHPFSKSHPISNLWQWRAFCSTLFDFGCQYTSRFWKWGYFLKNPGFSVNFKDFSQNGSFTYPDSLMYVSWLSVNSQSIITQSYSFSGGNKKMEGESSFRLGLGYDKVGNALTALLVCHHSSICIFNNFWTSQMPTYLKSDDFLQKTRGPRTWRSADNRWKWRQIGKKPDFLNTYAGFPPEINLSITN
jgi:hypothetical protein